MLRQARQPAPFHNFSGPSPRGKSDGTSWCSGVYSTLQSGQMVRTRRWAITPSTVLDTRKGSTPMSMSRVNAVGASLVWSVENTR